MSPFRKKLQELNVSAINDSNLLVEQVPTQKNKDDAYGAFVDLNASGIPPRQQVIKTAYQQKRANRDSYYSTNRASITGVSVMSALKPRFNMSVDRSVYSVRSGTAQVARRKMLKPSEDIKVDTTKVNVTDINKTQIPLSPQEYHESLCGRKLVEKMRGATSQERRPTAPNVSLPGINQTDTSIRGGALIADTSGLINATRVELEGMGSLDLGITLNEEQKEKKEETLPFESMDKYLEALLENKPEANAKFMYFNMKEDNNNQYDLEITTYSNRSLARYFTISKKGVTQYNGENAVEFVPLREWLIERDLFSHIQEISFFRNFHRWKLLNSWRKKIWMTRKKLIADDLEEKLFFLDPIYREHLLVHKSYVCEMSKLRLVDVSKHSETGDIDEFVNRQKKKRKETAGRIKEFSDKCRDNFRALIKKSLDKLRNRILLEKSLDDDRGSNKQATIKRRGVANPVFEALGFPENMTYGHRASLRRECSRFLRLAYLIDFLTIKSLGDIYLDTVRETINILAYLDKDAKAEINVGHDILRKAATQDPILLIRVKFDTNAEIPADKVVSKEVKAFNERESKPKQFDLSCHVELVPEKEEELNSISYLLRKFMRKEVPNIIDYYLSLSPTKEDFYELLLRCFSEGLKVLEAFERWSRHDELTPYASALEEWDEIVGGSWDEPESIYLAPKDYIGKHQVYVTQDAAIKDVVFSAYGKCNEFLKKFNKFLNAYWRNRNADLNLLVHERVAKPVETLNNALRLFEYQKKVFAEKIPETCNLGILKIDCSPTRRELLPNPVSAIKEIESLATDILRVRTEKIRSWVVDARAQLEIRVTTVEDYVKQKTAWNNIADNYQDKKDKIDIYGEIYNVLIESSIPIKKDDKQYHTETLQEVVQMNQLLANVSDQQELNLDKFKRKLTDQHIPQLQAELAQLKKEIDDEVLLTRQENIDHIIDKLNTLDTKFNSLEVQSVKYNEFQKRLNMEATVFELMDVVKTGLKLRGDLWRSLKAWGDLTLKWSAQPFSTINAKEIGNKAEEYYKIALHVDKELPENPVSKELKSVVDTFKKAVPILSALRNEDLEKSHWKYIKQLLQAEFERTDPSFTLRTLLDLKAIDFQEEIIQISVQATQEALLRGQLNQLDEQWKKYEFTFKQFKQKEVYLFDKIEDLLNLLDDSLAVINAILGNKYIKPLLAQAENWRQTLINLQTIMDEWIACQKQWVYLDNIFSSQDIRKQLINEVSKFDTVDKFFKTLMQKAIKAGQPNKLLKTYKGDLADHLRHNNKIMDEIKKMLQDYLDAKRRGFPRFYFLSGEELLELLANQHELDVVQTNLPKLFDNLYRLEIHEGQDIVAMESKEGERLQFFRASRVKENVEAWLEQIQGNIRDTLTRAMKDGITDYDDMDRKEWILKHPGQVVSTITQIIWCTATESAIMELATNENALVEWYEENVGQIKQVSELVRNNHDAARSKIVVNQISIDVHSRDVIESLILSNISHVNDFTWQKELRYYWEDEDVVTQQPASVSVRQLNCKMEYGYEYIGPTARLAVTPLTDRCWLLITSTLHAHLDVALVGPSGVGKMETVKDLAKSLGMYCVVFNCSEQINYKIMTRFFLGAAQQGAWICLNDFNKINAEVLSVTGKQLSEIRNAMNKGASSIMFEEKEYAIKNNYGIFAIMSHGYTKQEMIPDNVKANFRTVAMIQPDVEQIIDTTLVQEGFTQNKVLAKKISKFYKLASELLSSQPQYDFGLRTIKATITLAAAFKKTQPGVDEFNITISAIKRVNESKILPEDLQAFQTLIFDFFPIAYSQQGGREELKNELDNAMEKKGLKKVPEITQKSMQLFEAFATNIGVILVGQSGSGKTTVCEMLRDAVTELNKKKFADERYQKVNIETLNAVAIDLDELYGKANSTTQEWTDGVVQKIVRKIASLEGKEHTWIVFDSPLDSSWVETLNTALDGSRILCLPNGERLRLRKEMQMIFETNDLSFASPATVSRCGVVYIPGEIVGWQVYLEGWTNRAFPDESFINQELKSHIYFLFEQSIERGISKVRTSCTELIKTTDLQLVSSVCNLIEVLITPATCTGDKNDKKKTLTLSYFFALIWGLGGALDDSSREKVDLLVRSLFESIEIPPTQSAFEYYMDPKKGIRPWTDIIPAFVYNEQEAYYRLLIPTIETTRHGYILEQLLTKNKCAFYTGVSGVGKSLIVHNALKSLGESKGLTPAIINFSAETTSLSTQMSIEEKLQKKRRDIYGAQVGKKIVVFIDDVNLPSPGCFGAQPAVELLRQLIDKRGFYDREKYSWKWIEDTALICAGGPPGSGRHELSPRFTRKFNILAVSSPNKAVMEQIFTTFLSEHLKAKNFPEAIQAVAHDLVVLTLDLYASICTQLKPTPFKFHYTFNIKDLTRVFQGMRSASQQTVSSTEILGRLWMHEFCRSFYDRLTNPIDKEWLGNQIIDNGSKTFKTTWEYKDIFERSKIYWTDIGKPEASPKVYEELKDITGIRKLLEAQMDQYAIKESRKLNLVLFEDAVDHLLRIARVLRQPQGYILLIGIAGSGKSTLTKFAAFLNKCSVRDIDLKKDVSIEGFKALLKELLQSTGVTGTPICFIVNEAQIFSESMLDYINSILHNGEVPNLFTAEEMEKNFSDMRPIMAELKRDESRGSMQATFIERVKQNLKISICMSPLGDTLKTRCRKFPALINCCTVDWISRWSDSTLLTISRTHFGEYEEASSGVKRGLAEMCVKIHNLVEQKAVDLFKETKREVLVTPNMYLDLLRQYNFLYKQKKTFCAESRGRINNGLEKFQEVKKKAQETQSIIDQLQNLLKDKADLLETTQKKILDEQRVSIEKDKAAHAQTQDVNEKAKALKAITDEIESSLSSSKAEVTTAINEIKLVDKKNLLDVKSTTSPSHSVQIVMEAAMTLLQEKTEWSNVKLALADSNEFIAKLTSFTEKIETVPGTIIKKVKDTYVNTSDFDPEQAGHKSAAAKPIAKWVKAMVNYYDMITKAEPKKVKQEQEKTKFDVANELLATKQKEASDAKANVVKVKADSERLQQERTKIAEDIASMNRRFGRSEELAALFGDEGTRWEKIDAEVQEETSKLFGNTLLSAAIVVYLGQFTTEYRDAMCKQWIEEMGGQFVPVSDKFNFIKVMGNPTTISEWQSNGLLRDRTSIENSLITTSSRRWPLIIDPQSLANKWLKNIFKKQGIVIVKLSMKDHVKTICNCMRLAKPVLIEDIEDYIDPNFDSLLQRSFIEKEKGTKFILMDNKEVEFDENFQMYMTTKMLNPRYPSFVASKVTFVNFSVTAEGLEEIFLNDLAMQESSESETQLETLNTQLNNDRLSIKDSDDKILKLLSTSSLEQLLDDESVAESFKSAKKVANEIGKKIEDNERFRSSLISSRNDYRAIANRAALICSLAFNMIQVDIMYQFTLEYFKQLFTSAIEPAQERVSQKNRIKQLMTKTTSKLFNGIGKALLRFDRNMFAFLICVAIRTAEGAILPKEWSYFAKGATEIKREESVPNPIPKVVTMDAWLLVQELDRNIPDKFSTLIWDIGENKTQWIEYASSYEILKAKLPGKWNSTLSPFEKLLLIKILKPSRILPAIIEYVKTELGPEFIDFTCDAVEEACIEAKKTTPIVFLVSQSTEIIPKLQKAAEKRKQAEKFITLSLGQDQGPIAKKIVQNAQAKGEWVLLENVHLCKSLFKEIETLADTFKEAKTGVTEEFRLFLTTKSTDGFPAYILQSGIKRVDESPVGVKETFKRLCDEVIPTAYANSAKRTEEYHKLLFGLCMFHCSILSRNKFAPIGFKNAYDFNTAMLEPSITLMKMFIEDQEETPWEALNCIIGDANYGGSVFDEFDRRALLAQFKLFCCPEIHQSDYSFDGKKRFGMPTADTIEEYKNYANKFTNEELPSIFGLEGSVLMRQQMDNADLLFQTLLKVKPVISLKQLPEEAETLKNIAELQSSLPTPLDISTGNKELFQTKTMLTPLTNALVHEIHRYNKLIEVVTMSLEQVKNVLTGTIGMSAELEILLEEIRNNAVPKAWIKAGYPSKKALASWFSDLLKRVEYMRAWLTKGEPKAFWISAFIFPQGFLAAVLQTQVRKNRVSIEKLSFKFEILKEIIEEPKQKPKDGAMIYGLCMEQAMWDTKNDTLDDQPISEQVSIIPSIMLIPVIDYEPAENSYICPVYKTSARRNDDTGTEFIMNIDLPTKKKAEYWTLKGAVMVTQLNE